MITKKVEYNVYSKITPPACSGTRTTMCVGHYDISHGKMPKEGHADLVNDRPLYEIYHNVICTLIAVVWTHNGMSA